jgi:hypothetical protein
MEFIKLPKSLIEDRIKLLEFELKISEANGDTIRAGIEYHQIEELKGVIKMSEEQEPLNPFELNEYGLLVFKHKTNKRLFLQKAYRWVDRLILIDETEGRQIIDSHPYSTYNLSAWEPVTKEEYAKVKSKYKEIYD